MSSRDVGAAINIIEIVKLAKFNPNCDLFLYIQPPAANYFSNHNLQYELVPNLIIKQQDSNEANLILNYAQEVLNKVKPDIILCGLSTPGDAGIDEALISVAKNKIPTVVMQDFWGEVNDFFGVCADYHFCLDQEAKILTEQRYDSEGLVIGSPRHSWYKSLDLVHLRQELREKEDLSTRDMMIGLFGQSLHHIQGYKEILLDLLFLVTETHPEATIIYRQHPRESNEQAQNTIKLLENSKIAFRLMKHEKVEYTLILCDAVCSILSNCLYDASYLNFFSPVPFITPVSLCYEQDILKHLNNYNMINSSPYRAKNIAFMFDSKKPSQNELRYLFSESGKKEFWLGSKKLENPQYAAQKALISLLKISSLSNMDV
ncbi:hypothetical protein EP47_03190 [Legionella norrlandica]|uniref:UDP-N-acetylglucosamine 2-epimerase domain-containing protein n=1 Tax=Legionella norrlandica TaxID=1498499 RepID=A0A0A2SV79_9GAMM|nr:hypothetical protein [Legionella norrlandica]KGP63641.1 hypothetical protein EP47_03190 [Legionella norrlandica]